MIDEKNVYLPFGLKDSIFILENVGLNLSVSKSLHRCLKKNKFYGKHPYLFWKQLFPLRVFHGKNALKIRTRLFRSLALDDEYPSPPQL